MYHAIEAAPPARIVHQGVPSLSLACIVNLI